jgi:hypothetical protein
MNSSIKQGARRRVAPVVLAAALLVGGANIGAFAANGHAFLIGSRNVAGKTTTFVNHGSGPVISLEGKKSSPPLKVNSDTKVKHLNVDKVDGRSASSLANIALTYALSPAGRAQHVDYTFPGLPAGSYQVSYSISADLFKTGKAAPRLTCAVFANSGAAAQLTDNTPTATIVTANASGAIHLDAGADLRCNAVAGQMRIHTGAGSLVSFLKVDKQANGQAQRAIAE